MWWATNVAFGVNLTVNRGIGLMCGTSHDGLDLADVSFDFKDKWEFTIHGTRSFDLPASLRDRLGSATSSSAFELIKLDVDFARFTARSVLEYLNESKSSAQFIASHGVTVFHQPNSGLGLQIGNGGIISSLTGITTVSDFRIQDISKGGQGAPLIPVADKYLFPQFDHTLNLGGFANCTDTRNETIGFDICACNLALNHIAKKAGLSFDRNGELARNGSVIPTMFDSLNQLEFFTQKPPKSLGYEWFAESILPVLDQSSDSLENTAATFVEHIAFQISKVFNQNFNVLVTGGGTHNDFLLERIRFMSKARIEKPSDEIINFREAIAFSFLGLLRLNNLTNTYASVTGAQSDTISGAVYLGTPNSKMD